MQYSAAYNKCEIANVLIQFITWINLCQFLIIAFWIYSWIFHTKLYGSIRSCLWLTAEIYSFPISGLLVPNLFIDFPTHRSYEREFYNLTQILFSMFRSIIWVAAGGIYFSINNFNSSIVHFIPWLDIWMQSQYAVRASIWSRVNALLLV